MITLSSEKGFIRVDSWEDIESRPGFAKDLDPTEHQLDAIIGRYIFKDKIRCGLSNCHTPHAKGYIVLTKDRRETNIGKDCGKTYFGVDFETLSKKFERDVIQAENRERLWSFSFQLEELERRITELRRGHKGADWIHKNLRLLLTANAGCPEAVVRRVTGMVKARTNVLSREREASPSEIENLEAIQNRKLQRPYYVEQPIAEISGFDALYSENDLRTLLILDLEENIKAFRKKDIDSLSYEELRYWAKWSDAVATKIDHANQAVLNGRTLLEPKNLDPFLHVLTDQTDVSSFRVYLRSLSET